MTKESYAKATEIMCELDKIDGEIGLLEKRIARFDDYISFMDGRKPPVKFNGKTFPKAEVKFYMSEHITDRDIRDMFDLVDENKKEFVEFLKNCQKNYRTKMELLKNRTNALTEEFEAA